MIDMRAGSTQGGMRMDIMEIILLAVGGIIFVLSFIIPDRNEAGGGNGRGLAENEVKILVNQELESIRGHVDDVVEEAVNYAMEKTERSLERLSNEKIMAVSEYSDTVLAQIHKNHEEVMFLYDMLNNKQINLKNTVSEINRTVKEAEETVTSFQKLAPETAGTGRRIVEGMAVSDAGRAEDRQESSYDGDVSGGNTFHAGIAEGSTAVNGGGASGGKTFQSGNVQGGGKNSGRRNSSKKGSSKRNSPGKGTGAESGGAQNILQEQAVREGSGADQEAGRIRRGQQDGHTGNKEKILELYHQGKSAVEIAKDLGLGIGEVRLVIDLFKS